jgi:hypothetical protein
MTFTITHFSQFCYCQTSLPWPTYTNYCRFLLEYPISTCGGGWLSEFSWFKSERYDNMWRNDGLLSDSDDTFHKINLVYEMSVFTSALLTFQQPVQRALKIIILLMINTQLTASLEMSKATNMMTVWKSEITFEKMNTFRIRISEIYSTDRIRSI